MTVNRNTNWEKIQMKNGKITLSTNMKKLGAFVGDDVVIGAGNTVKPGTVVLPGENLPACYSVTN